MRSWPKRTRIRLSAEVYSAVRRQIFERDGWRCQICGSFSNLEVHHQQFRSQSGPDADDNLITLCSRCHSEIHAN